MEISEGRFRREVAGEFCRRVGNHGVCDVGRTAGFVAVRVLNRLKTAGSASVGDHDDFVNEVLERTPESWDDDTAAEHIALEYVRELERRVLALGGTLERWLDADDCTHGVDCFRHPDVRAPHNFDELATRVRRASTTEPLE